MTIGRYHEMLSRYYEAFPPERIHVFVFDDLKRDTPGVVRELYRFVGVDPDVRPDLETPHNIGGMRRAGGWSGFDQSPAPVTARTVVRKRLPTGSGDPTKNLRRAPSPTASAPSR
jgi:hypothetical protein